MGVTDSGDTRTPKTVFSPPFFVFFVIFTQNVVFLHPYDLKCIFQSN